MGAAHLSGYEVLDKLYDVCVLGLGYIGLPTALMLAANGSRVAGVERDIHLVERLQRGEITFQEEGLQDLFKQALDGNIYFGLDYPEAKVYIIAVPTPYDKNTKKIDPSYVVAAVGNVLDVCPKGTVIVIESTISPGTVDRHIRPYILSRGFTTDVDVHLAHAPERLIPGDMIRELRENPRIIGVDNTGIGEEVKKLYANFCVGEVIITDIRTAEMTKVVENTYRDVNIAFANELAKICRQDNLDVYEVIRIANMHPRVNILKPGPGVGGHCISVDPWFLVGDYPELSMLIHEARLINDSMPGFVLRRTAEIMDTHGIADSSRVGFYGITYKEDVDDTRESPTLQLYEAMRANLGGGARFFDPLCPPDTLPSQIPDFGDFLDMCDMIVIMVGHGHLLQNMLRLRGKVVLDTRNVCDLPGCYKL
jgi:UDP-N-acetyl-D-mannosaminuronic acid dehydrogenase